MAIPLSRAREREPSSSGRESATRAPALGASALAGDGVIDQQHHDGSANGHEQTVGVEARDAGHAEDSEQPAPHEGADDPENDIHQNSLSALVDDLACDESRDEP